MPSHELGPFCGKGLNGQLITSLSLTIVKSLFDFDPASDGSKELDSMTSLLPLNFKSVLCILNYGPIMLIKEQITVLPELYCYIVCTRLKFPFYECLEDKSSSNSSSDQ